MAILPPDLAVAYWRKLRTHIESTQGDRCADCGSPVATLRRITFVRGERPLPQDVKFLCQNCHAVYKPVPYREEFIALQTWVRQRITAVRARHEAEIKVLQDWYERRLLDLQKRHGDELWRAAIYFELPEEYAGDPLLLRPDEEYEAFRRSLGWPA